MFFNEILFNFNIRETLSLLVNLLTKDKKRLRLIKKE